MGQGYINFAKDGTPKSNTKQNKQTKKAARDNNLSAEGERELHDRVSGQGYGYKGVQEEAKAIADLGGKYVKN